MRTATKSSINRMEFSFSRLNHFLGKSALGFVVVTALLTAYGLARIYQATPAGIGVGGDSYSYITASDTLANGIGFGRINGRGDFVPTTHYPPFYPISLASLQVLGVDKLESTRWINVASFAALVFFAGIILRTETNSNYPGYAAGAVLVTAPPIFDISVWAMSEPLYLALGLAGLWVLNRYLTNGSRWLFILAALVIGLGYFTRYVGISLVATGTVALLFQKGSWRKRLIEAGIFTAISVIPVILWWVRNATLTGNFANRRIIWHPITYAHLKSLALTTLYWIIPKEFISSGLQALGLIALIAAIAGAILVRMRARGRLSYRFRRWGLPALLLTYSIAYLIAFGISLSLFDPFTLVNDRILLPIYVSAALIAAVMLWDIWNLQGRLIRLSIVVVLAFILVFNSSAQASSAQSFAKYGLGYVAPAVGKSETLAAVAELPQVPLVTNGIAWLYFWADRNSFAIPWQIDLETGHPDPAYEDTLRIMRSRLCEEDGYLILFRPERLVPEQAPLSDLTAGLSLYGDYSDGQIYDCVGD